MLQPIHQHVVGRSITDFEAELMVAQQIRPYVNWHTVWTFELRRRARKLKKAVPPTPQDDDLVAWGLTDEPQVVSWGYPDDYYVWEVVRWAGITPVGGVQVWTTVRKRLEGCPRPVFEITLPLSVRWNKRDPYPRFFVHHRKVTAEIRTATGLVAFLDRTGLLAGLAEGSNLSFGRLVQAIRGKNVYWDPSLPRRRRLEVCHLRRCSMADTAWETAVMPKGEHEAHDIETPPYGA